jgi:hypothetical protein
MLSGMTRRLLNFGGNATTFDFVLRPSMGLEAARKKKAALA